MKTNTNTNNKNYKMKYEGEHPSIHENRKHTARMIAGGVSTVALLYSLMLMARGWWTGGIVLFAVMAVVLSAVSVWESEYYERYGGEEDGYDGEDLFEE